MPQVELNVIVKAIPKEKALIWKGRFGSTIQPHAIRRLTSMRKPEIPSSANDAQLYHFCVGWFRC